MTAARRADRAWVRLLDSPSSAWRRLGTDARLDCRLGTQRAFDVAFGALEDLDVRGWAIEALGRFKRPEVIPTLERLELDRKKYEWKARDTAIRRLHRTLAEKR